MRLDKTCISQGGSFLFIGYSYKFTYCHLQAVVLSVLTSILSVLHSESLWVKRNEIQPLSMRDCSLVWKIRWMCGMTRVHDNTGHR